MITASIVVGTISPRGQQADRCDGRTLVRMMDKDMNGVVSRDEFMQFMGQTFDRLDVNKSGTLESKELLPLTVPGGLLSDCVHLAFPQCTGGQ